MKRILIGVAVAAGLSCSTSSADDWSGWYAGLGLGLAGDSYFDSYGDQIDFDGATTNLFAGYRTIYEDVAVGAELQAAAYLDVNTFHHGFRVALPNAAFSLISARANIGIPLENWMPYMAVGVALATQTHQVLGTSRSDTQSSIGAVFAAGVDVAINKHLFGRLEANFTKISEVDYHGFSGAFVRNEGMLGVTTGLAWKF